MVAVFMFMVKTTVLKILEWFEICSLFTKFVNRNLNRLTQVISASNPIYDKIQTAARHRSALSECSLVVIITTALLRKCDIIFAVIRLQLNQPRPAINVHDSNYCSLPVRTNVSGN